MSIVPTGKSKAEALLLKRGLIRGAHAVISAVPLMGVLGVVYATGLLHLGGLVAAVFTALLITVGVEPVRSMLAHAALADQHRVQFCAQAMVALELTSDFVYDLVTNYHYNWHPRPNAPQKARADRIIESLLPVIGLANMWAPKVTDPLETLVSEIRDACEFGTPKVEYPPDSYPSLREALGAARDAVNVIRSELPR